MKLTITYDQDIPINAFRWTPNKTIEPLHYHASLEIGYCVSGKGKFYFGDKQYTVAAGDIFIVNNLELHVAQSDVDDPSTYIFINFDPNLIMMEEVTLLLPFAYRPDRFDNRISAGSPLAAELAALIDRIYRELADKREGYRSMAKSALLEINVLLLRNYSVKVSHKEWKRMTESYRKLLPALSLIEKRFREEIALKDVANLLNVSSSRASRLIHEELGRSFKDYVLNLRMNEAKRLLLSTNRSMAEICFDSGFQSMATFYRLFKTITGMSPLEYRSNHSVRAIIENES